MKRYTDVLGNRLTSDDLRLAISVLCTSKRRPSSSLLQRRLGWGYGKVMRTYEVLEDAGVVAPIKPDASRTLLLKNEASAINAALRQLKKGKK